MDEQSCKGAGILEPIGLEKYLFEGIGSQGFCSSILTSLSFFQQPKHLSLSLQVVVTSGHCFKGRKIACLANDARPLACLAAALGPLACLVAALGPLAKLTVPNPTERDTSLSPSEKNAH